MSLVVWVVGGAVVALIGAAVAYFSDDEIDSLSGGIADPLSSINGAIDRASPIRTIQDMSFGQFHHGKNIVLDAGQIARLARAMRKGPKGFLGKDPATGRDVIFRTQEAYERAQEAYKKRYYPPAPTKPYNPDLAARLAPGLNAHIRANLGWYTPATVAQFQEAAGLRDQYGVPDGVYGGRTAGALRYYLNGAQPAAPVTEPDEEIEYFEP